MIRRAKGFTLVELMIVIVIIGILASLITISFVPVQRKGRDARRKSDLGLFAAGLKLFESDFKLMPNFTFNLGTQGNDTDGDSNSDLGLDSDVPACNNLSQGAVASFVVDQTGATPGALVTEAMITDATPGATKYRLKPGFVAVNHMLICLKYADRLFTDPSFPSGTASNYLYMVNYDYSSYLVSAQLETTTDQDAKSTLFACVSSCNPGATFSVGRYFEGNGINERHLDDDTNSPKNGAVADGATGNAAEGFYAFSANAGNDSDGKYFYQCVKRGDGADILPDDRSSSVYAPTIINSSGQWIANVTDADATKRCQSTPDGNKVAVQAY